MSLYSVFELDRIPALLLKNAHFFSFHLTVEFTLKVRRVHKFNSFQRKPLRSNILITKDQLRSSPRSEKSKKMNKSKLLDISNTRNYSLIGNMDFFDKWNSAVQSYDRILLRLWQRWHATHSNKVQFDEFSLNSDGSQTSFPGGGDCRRARVQPKQ